MKSIPFQGINQWIEESQRAFSGREARIIQQGDKSGESGRRRRRAANTHRSPSEKDTEVLRLSRDVRNRLHKKPDDDHRASRQSKGAMSSPSLLRDNGASVHVLYD